ncbi:helix-turn-helix transcriptional regulator [Stenotrophomonas nematodicola]|uniref:Helix-turn-helix transcriptional regulator n=1 Tax=Stenotrophomonas nematodicola TaxID=2656746 RepID=A0ABW7D1S0_9GAMM
MTENATSPPRLLRLKEVQDRVGMSKTTIYDRVRTKNFPAPVHLGTMAAWVESEVDAWILDRINDRDHGKAA